MWVVLVAALVIAAAGQEQSGTPPPIGGVSVETFCENSTIVLARSRPEIFNGGEVAFVISTAGTPAFIMLSSLGEYSLSLRVHCDRIGSNYTEALELSRSYAGMGYVFEGIVEYIPSTKWTAFEASSRTIMEPHYDPATVAFSQFTNFSHIAWRTEAGSTEDGDVVVSMIGAEYGARVDLTLSAHERKQGLLAVTPMAVTVKFAFDQALLRTKAGSYYAPQFLQTAPLLWTEPSFSVHESVTDDGGIGLFLYTVASSRMDRAAGNDSAFIAWPNVASSDAGDDDGRGDRIGVYFDPVGSVMYDRLPFSVVRLFLGQITAYHLGRFTVALQRAPSDGILEWDLVAGNGVATFDGIPQSTLLAGIICGGLPVVLMIIGGPISCVMRKRNAPRHHRHFLASPHAPSVQEY